MICNKTRSFAIKRRRLQSQLVLRRNYWNVIYYYLIIFCQVHSEKYISKVFRYVKVWHVGTSTVLILNNFYSDQIISTFSFYRRRSVVYTSNNVSESVRMSVCPYVTLGISFWYSNVLIIILALLPPAIKWSPVDGFWYSGCQNDRLD